MTSPGSVDRNLPNAPIGESRRTPTSPCCEKIGRMFYADIMGNNLTYGGRPCVLGLYRDISGADDGASRPRTGTADAQDTCCNRATTNDS